MTGQVVRIDGAGTARAVCLLAPNPSPMTLDGTNTWVVCEPGSSRAVVVDPGPDDRGHLERIRDHVASAGQAVSAILLTHSHRDHSAGAATFAAMTGAPVLAADPALRRGDEGLAPGMTVTSGGCEIAVLATPGHSADSVCLHIPADRALLTGDTVLGRGTTVIARDGNLADYLGTLDRLRALADGTGLAVLLPGHGPVLTDPGGTLDFYLAHRRQRLAEISSALAAGDRTLAEIVTRVYGDVDTSLRRFAEMSVRAQLEYLRSQESLPPGVSY